jgi:hypothetical protein
MNKTQKDTQLEIIKNKYLRLKPELNERTRRLWAATEAQPLGYGGVSLVVKATGIDHKTITRGMAELADQKLAPDSGRIRHTGGGRKSLIYNDLTLLGDIVQLVGPHTRGDPMTTKRYSSKSGAKVAKALQDMGHEVSVRTTLYMMNLLNYNLQANRKTSEGNQDPDRDFQFQYIGLCIDDFHSTNDPVISVDTKKKENIGNYANVGREWRLSGQPVEVNMHDFPDKDKGIVAPYGVIDLTNNEGWVNVGIDHDTAEFAVNSIRTWWNNLGKKRFPNSQELLITADGGGSNGSRVRLWKVELQKLANETGLTIYVRHYPPGTSKWNPIEHRMFCFITKNWRGEPLIDRATVIDLISATTNEDGLKVYASLDENKYEKGIKISDKELAKVNLHEEDFHGKWNYRIEPQVTPVTVD